MAGSVVLAGIPLKLRTYGFLRFSIPWRISFHVWTYIAIVFTINKYVYILYLKQLKNN